MAMEQTRDIYIHSTISAAGLRILICYSKLWVSYSEGIAEEASFAACAVYASRDISCLSHQESLRYLPL